MSEEDEEAWINSGDNSTFSEWKAKKNSGILYGQFKYIICYWSKRDI